MNMLLERAAREWPAIAGEPVRMEEIGGTLYGFCSELGALRLEHKFGASPRIKAGWSENVGSWFFRVEQFV
jgi:hypothetical protein